MTQESRPPPRGCQALSHLGPGLPLPWHPLPCLSSRYPYCPHPPQRRKTHPQIYSGMLRTPFEAISEVRRSRQFPIDLFVPPWAGALCPRQSPEPYQTSAAPPGPRGAKTQGRALKPSHGTGGQLGGRTPDLQRRGNASPWFCWINGAVENSPLGPARAAQQTPPNQSPTLTADDWAPAHMASGHLRAHPLAHQNVLKGGN